MCSIRSESSRYLHQTRIELIQTRDCILTTSKQLRSKLLIDRTFLQKLLISSIVQSKLPELIKSRLIRSNRICLILERLNISSERIDRISLGVLRDDVRKSRILLRERLDCIIPSLHCF